MRQKLSRFSTFSVLLSGSHPNNPFLGTGGADNIDAVYIKSNCTTPIINEASIDTPSAEM